MTFTRKPTERRPRSNRFTPWALVVRGLSRGVDRDRVIEDICEAGQASGRYAMMSVLSAAIATLGLLLSSPAVIIGAMLLSPLMGPIILLGFAFRTVDWNGTRRAVQSLAIGLGLSLAVAILLTWVSPLKEPTAEILARTRPNLFDLLVAAFSGVAGAYAVIRQRGETAIGVAIATALMPPLATLGFGLGTADWTIATGSLLLFATNLVAIALAAAVVAALYGFRPDYQMARRGWVGHGAVILILLALCVPLTLSLETIALESRATVRARHVIAALFGGKARITSLSVRSLDGQLQVDGLVATPRFVDHAATKVEQQLRSALGKPASVTLDQVVLANPAQFAAAPAKPEPAPDPATLAMSDLREAVPFATQALAYDPRTHAGVVMLEPGTLDLNGAMQLETGLRRHDGLEHTIVVPSMQRLVPVSLALPKTDPPKFGAGLTLDLWALQRWRAHAVTARLCGLAPADRRRLTIETPLAKAMKPLVVKLAPARLAQCRRQGLAGVFLLLEPA